jgi:hypothetical protein
MKWFCLRRVASILVLVAVVSVLGASPLVSQEPPLAVIILDERQGYGISQTIVFVTVIGGKVRHVFPPSVLIGHVPDGVDRSLLVQRGIVAVHRQRIDYAHLPQLSAKASMGIGAWNALLQSRVGGMAVLPSAPLSLLDDVIRIPVLPSSTGTGTFPETSSLTTSPKSSYLIGTIAVGVVLPEGSGDLENWSEARRDEVGAEIIAGRPKGLRRQPA